MQYKSDFTKTYEEPDYEKWRSNIDPRVEVIVYLEKLPVNYCHIHYRGKPVSEIGRNEDKVQAWLDELYPVIEKPIIFTDNFLDSIGFRRTYTSEDVPNISKKGQYGKAVFIKNEMTILEWNEEGASCTYFGEPLPHNVYFGIRKDGGTRTVFSGYVFTQDEVRLLLKLTW